MRVVFFDFNNNFGGAPQVCVHLARLLSSRNEVHIVDAYGKCEAYRRVIEEAGLPYRALMPEASVTVIGKRGVARLMALLRQVPAFVRLRRRLIDALLEIDPDVIWVMNEKSLTFVISSPRLWRYARAFYVMGWGTGGQVGRWLRWLMRRRVGAVLAVSTTTLDEMKRIGVPEHKLHLGSVTVNVEKLKREAAQPLEKELPGSDKHPRILMLAARPTREKGHVTAYQAIARLKQAGYDPALWLSGRLGVGVGDSFVKELEELAKELGIEDNVLSLGWIENISAVINACDIAILPSHTEGLPRSILEAMAIRKPVIATPVGGVTDPIKDGVTGHLMPVGDAAALAGHIEHLIADPEHTARIVDAAHQHLRDTFGEREYTLRIERIFRDIVRNDR